MRVIDPIAAPAEQAGTYAARPADLFRAQLGGLINGKEYSEPVLRAIVRRLTEAHDVRPLWWDKRFPAKPAPFLDEIAQRVPLVINGIGH
jgi:hypothetical protein